MLGGSGYSRAMTEYNDQYWNDLGERWVRAGGRWRNGLSGSADCHDYHIMIGPSATEPPRFCDSYPTAYTLGRELLCHGEGRGAEHLDGFVPDLRDPATAGCLLADVREAYGDPTIFASCLIGNDQIGNYWDVFSRDCDHDKPFGEGRTEAEALVAALEAARKRGEQ